MIEVVPARLAMLKDFRLQEGQRVTGQEASVGLFARLLAYGPANAILHEGKPVAFFGITPMNPDRAVVWTMLSDNISAIFLPIHRVIRRAMHSRPEARLESYVAASHEEGHRWMKTLGFQRRALLPNHHEGHDYVLYTIDRC